MVHRMMIKLKLLFDLTHWWLISVNEQNHTFPTDSKDYYPVIAFIPELTSFDCNCPHNRSKLVISSIRADF